MTAKTERLNLRCSSDSLTMLREAAEVQGQDLTSFILGASLDRARTVLAEERVLKLTPDEVMQLERALDNDGSPNPQLRALAQKIQGRLHVTR